MQEEEENTEEAGKNNEERKQPQNIENTVKKTFGNISQETPRKVKTATSKMKKETPGKLKNLKRLKPEPKTPSKPRSSLTPRKQLGGQTNFSLLYLLGKI